jgi:hypothetical protein
MSQIGQIDQDRKIHSPDHQGMGFGKHFEKITFKESGLPFIVYFFKFHAAKILRETKILN